MNKWLRCVRVWFCVTVLWMMSSLSFASSWSLDGQWQLFQSKQIVNIDDVDSISHWQSVTVPGLLSINPNNGMYGVYRYQFDFSKNNQQVNDKLALFIDRIRLADITYLNGQQIGHEGVLAKNWDIFQDNPNNLPRSYNIPKGLLQAENNELIIMIELGFAQSTQALLPGGTGIGGHVKIMKQTRSLFEYYQALTQSYVFDSIIVLLGFIDLVLIFFLFKKTFHSFPEFKWLLMSSVLLFLGSFLLDIGYLLGVTNAFTRMLLMLSILLLPLVNALFFNAQHFIASRLIIITSAALVCVFTALIMLPMVHENIKHISWVSWNILTIVFFIFALYCAGLNVKQKRVGAVTMLLGLIAYLFLIRTQWLPNDGFENRNVVIGSLIFRYALIWVYFLKIRELSVNYRELSTQMLSEMELSKQSIARDIHDELGQHLASAKLQHQLLSQTHLEKHGDLLKQELQNAIDSMRRIINGLHPIILEKHTLKEAIEIEAKRMSMLYDIEIDVLLPQTQFDQVSNTHLYRLTQELINNAVKHGKATHILIELKQHQNLVCLRIKDDGVGFDTAINTLPKSHKLGELTGGFGEVSMRERVDLLGGKILFESKINQGTKVTITLRLKGNQIA